ncbi:MAG TPA: SDR family oxidoreductase [Solirubrobacteraceae bacterium]|jgi:NAD(P)-dependent dehydrogenase (short-subunit alcohol dehydrogenase family)|nr:SDR family oxidoreductase [Solirubrobacteraceae bacterium]
MREFRNKVCVITGAGSGIGQALALDLAGRGARLALSDIDAERAAATAERAAGLGAEVEHYVLDVASRESVYGHAAAVKERFGAVNLVINNAGVALAKDVIDTPIEDYEWIMGINFWGVLYGSQAFLPHLIESGDGHLVNISSVFGIFAVPGQSGYNAAKFAVRGFTEALRQEMLLAGHPVGVSCVHPGGIATNIARDARTDQGTAQEFDDAFKKIARTSPAKAAATILKGVEKERARILVGPDAQVLDLMTRTLGSRYQGLVWRATKRLNPLV